MARYFLQVRAEEGSPWRGLGSYPTRAAGEAGLAKDPHSPEHKQLIVRAGHVEHPSRYQLNQGTSVEVTLYGAYENRAITRRWLARAKKHFGAGKVRKWQDRLLFSYVTFDEVKAWFNAQPQEVD